MEAEEREEGRTSLSIQVLLKENLDTHSPVERHFVSQLLLVDVAVQHVVADVGGGSVHAFDKDLPLGDVEVVVQEGAAVFGLPEELLGHVAPELCRNREVTWSGRPNKRSGLRSSEDPQWVIPSPAAQPPNGQHAGAAASQAAGGPSGK